MRLALLRLEARVGAQASFATSSTLGLEFWCDLERAQGRPPMTARPGCITSYVAGHVRSRDLPKTNHMPQVICQVLASENKNGGCDSIM